MIILVLIAITSLILGILFFVNREFLKRFEHFLNRSITTINVGVDKYYKTIGIFLVVFSCILFIIFLSVRR